MAKQATEWMDENELAELTTYDTITLKQYRYERKVFPFYKIPGTRKPLYKRSEINKIIEQGRVEVANV